MVVVYCEMCGQRVPEEQLQAGSAVCFSDHRYYCKKCSTKLLKTPRETPKSLTKTPRPGVLRAHTRPTSKRRFDTNWLVIGGGAVAVFAVVAIFTSGVNPASSAARVESVAHLNESTASPSLTSVNLAPQSAPVVAAAASAPAPSPVVDERERELEQMRLQRAMKLLDEARADFRASPGDPWSYRDRLLIVAGSYRNTPAATEAAQLLAQLKMPAAPRPAPMPPAAKLPIAWSDEEDAGWRPLLDGRSPPFLGGTWGFWKYDEGTLVCSGSASNLTEFSLVDGEVRIRFQVNDTPYTEITFRHSETKGYGVAFDRRVLETLWGRPLELIVSCNGDAVKGTLNGHPLAFTPGDKPRSGHIHICNAAGAIRIFSLDFRPIAAVRE